MERDAIRQLFGTDCKNMNLKFEDLLWCIEKFDLKFEVTIDGLNYTYKIDTVNLAGLEEDSEDLKKLVEMGWSYDDRLGCLVIEQER